MNKNDEHILPSRKKQTKKILSLRKKAEKKLEALALQIREDILAITEHKRAKKFLTLPAIPILEKKPQEPIDVLEGMMTRVNISTKGTLTSAESYITIEKSVLRQFGVIPKEADVNNFLETLNKESKGVLVFTFDGKEKGVDRIRIKGKIKFI